MNDLNSPNTIVLGNNIAITNNEIVEDGPKEFKNPIKVKRPSGRSNQNSNVNVKGDIKQSVEDNIKNRV